jgi:dienelactone hydrolase
MRALPAVLFAAAIAAGCSSDPSPAPVDAAVAADAADGSPTDDAPNDVLPTDVNTGPARSVFDLDADTAAAGHFYDLPFPSDLRRTAAGGPDYAGLPIPATAALVRSAVPVAQDRTGFPVLPVGWFRFDAPLAARAVTDAIAATAGSPVLLMDVGATSPDRGQLIPTVAATLVEDGYTPENVLAVAPYPGFVLKGGRTYAFVLTSALRDRGDRPVAASAAIEGLRAGRAPAGRRGAAAAALYAPLWEALRMRSIDPATVVAATVFTTGDAVAETARLGDRVVERFDVTVDGLALAPTDNATVHPRYCEFRATVTMPQFQFGAPPFNTDGLMRLGADGVPMTTTYPSPANYARVPVTVTIPRGAMPAGGYPLVMNIHGSGGYSDEAVSRGTWRPMSATNPCTTSRSSYYNQPGMYRGVAGCYTPEQGVAHYLAPRGFAVVGAAMPLNPERLPGASDIAYLNLMNPAAMRDTFRQGLFEQRLLLEALTRLRIPAATVAACAGATLPDGATEGRFDASRFLIMGQSMGGMYTHFIAATEPAVRGAIPTGGGGHWSRFIFESQIIPGVGSLIGTLLQGRSLSFVHPAMGLLQTLWEPVDPAVYVPRISRDVLPGKTPVSAYVPVGRGDSYFSTSTFDEIALAYGHPQGGREVWPGMQASLTLDGRAGLVPYPIAGNLMRGTPATTITSAVVQYDGDGVYDPHAIFTQLDAVKVQYGCFAQTLQRTGRAVIVDPMGRTADGACE